MLFSFFFFNDTATTEIYTLSLHDALPISSFVARCRRIGFRGCRACHEPLYGVSPSVLTPDVSANKHTERSAGTTSDRKSTRLNSSHANISYAVFCLKKKKLWMQHNI